MNIKLRYLIRSLLLLTIFYFAQHLLVFTQQDGQVLQATSPKQVLYIGVDGIQNNHFVEMLNAGDLPNFSRVISGGGWRGTATITGHDVTQTAPGNAELFTGRDENFTGISDNTCNQVLPDGRTVFEILKNHDSNIRTGVIYGKDTCYLAEEPLANAMSSIDWWQNRHTYSVPTYEAECTPLSGSVRTTADVSTAVATRATTFISSNINSPFLLMVYFGPPDPTGHQCGENSIDYDQSIIDVDNGLGGSS